MNAGGRALPLAAELAALEAAVAVRDWPAAALADASLRVAAARLLSPEPAPGIREALVVAIERHRAITEQAAVAAGTAQRDLALLDRRRRAAARYLDAVASGV